MLWLTCPPHAASTFALAIALPVIIFAVVWIIGLLVPFFCCPQLYVSLLLIAVFSAVRRSSCVSQSLDPSVWVCQSQTTGPTAVRRHIEGYLFYYREKYVWLCVISTLFHFFLFKVALSVIALIVILYTHVRMIIWSAGALQRKDRDILDGPDPDSDGRCSSAWSIRTMTLHILDCVVYSAVGFR